MRKRTNPEGAPASVEDCIVSLVRDSFPYTGQAITPQVTVTTQDGVPLVVNVDYFVSYSDNINVGAGTVTITGAGEYVGSVIKTFQITSAAPSTGWDFDLQKVRVIGSQVVNDYYASTGTYISHGTKRGNDDLILHYSNYGDTFVKLEMGQGFSLPLTESRLAHFYPVEYMSYGYWFSDDKKTCIKAGNYSGNTRVATFHSENEYDFEFLSVFANASSSINTSGGQFGLIRAADCYIELAGDGSRLILSGGFSYNIHTSSLRPCVCVYSVSDVDDLPSIVLEDSIWIKDLDGMPDTTLIFRGCVFSPDGTVMVLMFNKAMYKYRLSEPYKVSSGVTLESHFDDSEQVFGSGVTKLTGILFNEDGTRALVFNASNHTAYLIDFNKES